MHEARDVGQSLGCQHNGDELNDDYDFRLWQSGRGRDWTCDRVHHDCLLLNYDCTQNTFWLELFL